MAGKEAIVIVLDVSQTMGEHFNQAGQTKLDVAIEATRLFVRQKLLLAKSHEVGIILMGTEETENDLNEEYGGYENITVIQELDIPTLDVMRYLSGIGHTRASADIVDSVVVGVNMIEQRVGKKKFYKQLFVITDGNASCDQPDQLSDIISKINSTQIKLNVITVGFGGDLSSTLTAKQEVTEEVLKALVEGTNGAIFPSYRAIEIYRQFKKRKIYPVAKYKGRFEIAGDYAIEIGVYGKTKEETAPSLKKHSKAVDYTRFVGEAKVKMTRESALEDDPSSTVVDDEDIIKAYYYGKSVVPVAEEEEAILKFTADKCCKLLGFIASQEIPRHFFMGGVDIVLPAQGNVSQEILFNALCQAMKERDHVALVRYNPRANSYPRLAVLTPNSKPNVVCMWLNFLPTEEDVRDYDFSELVAATPEQVASAERFIDALSLERTAENGEQLELLAAEATFNPTIQYLHQCIAFRAEHPDEALPELDPTIAEYLQPDQHLYDQAKAEIDAFCSNFVLREVAKAPKKKKLYSDAIKLEEVSKPNYEPAPLFPSQISEVNPIEDFLAFISDRGQDRTAAAVEQMQAVILKLIQHAFRGNTYEKALECLKVLRQGCLNEDEVPSFNAFMKEQLRPLQATHSDFWNLLVSSQIGLVTTSESDQSDVSPAEAAQFLVKVELASQPTQNLEESMLDDIE